MKRIAIAAAAVVLAAGVAAAGEPEVAPKIPPKDITVKIQAPDGTSDADIADGIAQENARRDPRAQEAARVAKQKADADEAHHTRVSKICDSIPEDSLAKDASLRRMCGQ